VSFGQTDQRAANSQSDAANNSDGPDGGRRQAVTGSLAQIFQRIGSGDSGGPLFVPLVGLVGALATAGFTATADHQCKRSPPAQLSASQVWKCLSASSFLCFDVGSVIALRPMKYAAQVERRRIPNVVRRP
jgi:hypothetical protein